MVAHSVIPKFDNEHFYLSNFYNAPIKFGLFVFETNEHAFQAAKSRAMDNADEALEFVKLLTNPFMTPGQAKGCGRKAKINLDKWESIKVRAMRDIVMTKFLQHPDLRAKLLATGAGMLVEGNTWDDKFWGRCEGKGLNVLGSILMEVRGFWQWKEQCNGHADSDCYLSVLFDRSDW
jgi:ribA/ribD-fused uncharacterized protein